MTHLGITGNGGQPVIHKTTGRFGMTTGERNVRTETIGVIWEDQPYDVKAQLSDLIPAFVDAHPVGW